MLHCPKKHPGVLVLFKVLPILKKASEGGALLAHRALGGAALLEDRVPVQDVTGTELIRSLPYQLEEPIHLIGVAVAAPLG